MPSKVAQNKSYYDQGSTELAVASRLTLRKLERRRELSHIEQKTVIVLVGLPGRGKSFIGRKLQTFLTWRGVPCRVFNVGQYRRKTEEGSTGTADANFFDAANTEAARLREDIAMTALQDLLHWLARDNNDDNDVEEEESSAGGDCDEGAPTRQGGDSTSEFAAGPGGYARGTSFKTRHYTSSRSRSRVAIFDATNSTKARRDAILETCAAFQRERRLPNAMGVVFVESVCNDQELLDDNFRYKISTSPDFHGVSPAEALDDLRSRAQKYEDRYETIEDDSLSYIKIFNFSSKLMANQIYGRVSKVIVPALMAWHIGNRPIYLCRAGKTFGDDECDVCNDDGEQQPQQRPLPRPSSRDAMDASGHSQISYASSITAASSSGKRSVVLQQANLGTRGRQFRDALSDYITQEGVDFMRQVARAKGQSPLKKGSSVSSLMTGTSVTGKATLMTGVPAPVEDDARHAGGDEKKAEEAKDADYSSVPSFPCFVMTSTMPRAIQTASKLPFDINEYSHLNPLDKGDFIGMDLDEIMVNEPGWYEQLQKDPFRTRFPGGECYQDLVNRLETTIIDMEQQVAPVLVVSHVSVIQCLLAYFRGSPVESCTTIEVPTHTVFKLTPLRGGGWRETLHHLSTDESSDGSGSDSEAGDAEELRKPIWGDTFRVVNSYEQ